jgi:hypothetical protein
MVQGLAFLSKKSWHTKNLANQEKVWIAQQRLEQEVQKTAELSRQIQQEREQDELDKIAGKTGRLDRGIDWMYSGQHKYTEEQEAKEAEEYLLGKQVVGDGGKKSDLDVGNDNEGVNAVVQAASTAAVSANAAAVTNNTYGPSGVAATAEPSVAERNEAFRVRHEDPMFQVGMAAREKKVQAVQKKELYEKVMGGGGGPVVDKNDEESQSSRKRRKRKSHKKHKRRDDDKKKSRHHRHSSRSRSRSPDSYEDKSRKRDRQSRSRSRDRDMNADRPAGSSRRRLEDDDRRDGRRHRDRHDGRRERSRSRSRSRDRDQDDYRRRDRDRDRDEGHGRRDRSYHGGDRHSESDRNTKLDDRKRPPMDDRKRPPMDDRKRPPMDDRKRPPNYERDDRGAQHPSSQHQHQHHHAHHHNNNKSDVDDSSKRKQPGFGLQGPSNAAASSSSSIRIQPGDLGPNQDLLRKKREERDAERRRIKEVSSSRRHMTPEERAKAVRAMEVDAHRRHADRDRQPHHNNHDHDHDHDHDHHHHHHHHQGSSGPSNNANHNHNRTGGASFLHEITQKTHGVRDGNNMSMAARLAQNRHTNQKSHDSFL